MTNDRKAPTGLAAEDHPKVRATPVIHPDDLEFELELGDVDDFGVPLAPSTAPPAVPTKRQAAERPGTPFGLPVPASSVPPVPRASLAPESVRTEVPPLPDARPAPPPAPPARGLRPPARPPSAQGADPSKGDAGSRYAVATRGSENTVVAPRRPVVVPGKR